MGWAPWASPVKGSVNTCMTEVQMVMAPTYRSLPYLSREVLKAMETRLSVDCMIKGETPMATTGSSTLDCKRR